MSYLYKKHMHTKIIATWNFENGYHGYPLYIDM